MREGLDLAIKWPSEETEESLYSRLSSMYSDLKVLEDEIKQHLQEYCGDRAWLQ